MKPGPKVRHSEARLAEIARGIRRRIDEGAVIHQVDYAQDYGYVDAARAARYFAVHTDGLSPLQYRRRVFVEQMKIALHAGVSARAAGELWLDMTPEGARKLFGAVVGMSPIAWRRLYAGAPVEERIVASEDIAWRLVVREGWMRVAWAEGPADQRRLIRPLPRDAHAGETTILTPDGAQHHVESATNE